MDDNFSPRVKDVIAFSKEEALRLGHNFIGTEHLMLGILRDGGGKAIAILNSIEINLEELRRKVEILNPASIDDTQTLNDKKNLHLTRQAERALKTTFLENKITRQINCESIWPNLTEINGFEIHNGVTELDISKDNLSVKPIFKDFDLGWFKENSEGGTIAGTYIHGIFENDEW